MRIAFLVGDSINVTGGSNVIIEHASRLSGLGHDVSLLATSKPETLSGWQPRLAQLSIESIDECSGAPFDFVFATWWQTYFDLHRLSSRVYGYFNQSLESRFHLQRTLKLLNRTTYALPVLFVTEARWLAEHIASVQPGAVCLRVPNGLSEEFFPRATEIPAAHAGPLRVLVEGPWYLPFKGVRESFELLEQAALRVPLEVGWLTANSSGERPAVAGKPVRVHERVPIDQVCRILQQYDVMVKLSRVEGMFGPPLEMFSQGGTAIALTVTGSDEFMVHGENSLLLPPYDLTAVPRYLELLSASPAYLRKLREGALRTARAWPDWDRITPRLAQELDRLVAEGYSNEHLRPALTALAALRAHWLEDEESGADLTLRSLGAGEALLMKRYRWLKSSAPIRALQRLVPQAAREALRARLTGLLK